MGTIDYTDLILSSGNISSALAGLQSMIYNFPNAGDVKPDDLDKINGIVAAISILAKKNEQVVADHFEY